MESRWEESHVHLVWPHLFLVLSVTSPSLSCHSPPAVHLLDHHDLRSGCLGGTAYPHLPGLWSPSISQAMNSDVTEGGDSQAPTLHHPGV